ncbi:hypothetical protein XW81_01190 [Buchnera aphidicola (Schlechtendalia chinensis)]|uniref:SsrA-binding protein n=1 Tax=Buchnera aphidicola subsp. Schlechtendalia chinensis TaxID=118110 RepID=A0A172WDG5_BUCSC|nr:SsrA-binding protein SmpB [Buchnera aphidicola]ANF17023.1 hypothetical protein XW81_01190 [Buchnera aphidicola (Schlechtendalia chinensis)]
MKHKVNDSVTNIVVNRKAKYNYFVESTLDAGLVLLGWEVKALKLGNVNIVNSYVSFHLGEVYLFGVQFNPLHTTSLHTFHHLKRKIKVLLKKNEIISLHNKIYKNGYTAIVLSFFLKNSWCKIKIAIAKGKTQRDKRDEEKKSMWNLEKSRIMKKVNLV